MFQIYLKNVLTAAELADKKRREGLFFQAVKDGNVAAINELVGFNATLFDRGRPRRKE